MARTPRTRVRVGDDRPVAVARGSDPAGPELLPGPEYIHKRAPVHADGCTHTQDETTRPAWLMGDDLHGLPEGPDRIVCPSMSDAAPPCADDSSPSSAGPQPIDEGVS